MNEPTIAELLERSRAAHQQFRRLSPHIRAIGGLKLTTAGDVQAARVHLEAAGAYRKEAHDRDPDMADPAWVDDMALGFEHSKVLTFYAEQAARPLPTAAEVAARVATAKR